MPHYPMMHTFQLYNDVPAIECGDGSLMSDSFAPIATSEEYNDRWRLLDPALWSYQSIEGPDDVSMAHLMSLKRHISDLANSANGHGNPSPTTMLGNEFSHLGLQAPFSRGSPGFHGPRYMSPSGHLEGSLSSSDSVSDYASSPDAARHSVKPFYAHYDSQETYSSPTYNEGAAFGNWVPQKLYQPSAIRSPPSYDNRTACNMKDLQYTTDLDVDEEPLEDNDCIKVEVHGPEVLGLHSPATPTASFRDEALGQSIRDDASSFRDDDEDRYQESEAESEYSPRPPKRRNSYEVKSPGRKTPKRTRSINNTVLGEPKVTKSTQKKNNSTRGPSSRPAKSVSNTQKRVFTCAFSHYGCEATFGSKNEWKRHVGSQHLQLGFYRCDTDFCDPDKQSSSTKSHSSTTKSYNDFNRKDLFTQHHRRMHTPWNSTSREPSSKVHQDFENSLEEVRKRCWHERRTPPQRSTCVFCRRVFEGPTGWEERMEHVGKHFEGKNNGAADVESLQEEEDEDLREWAVKEGIVRDYGTRGFWLLGMEPVEVKTVAGRSSRRRGRGQQEVKDEDDVDAEGENE
jgi:hypothetical protein